MSSILQFAKKYVFRVLSGQLRARWSSGVVHLGVVKLRECLTNSQASRVISFLMTLTLLVIVAKGLAVVFLLVGLTMGSGL